MASYFIGKSPEKELETKKIDGLFNKVLNCENYYFKEYTAGADIVMEDAYPVDLRWPEQVVFSSLKFFPNPFQLLLSLQHVLRCKLWRLRLRQVSLISPMQNFRLNDTPLQLHRLLHRHNHPLRYLLPPPLHSEPYKGHDTLDSTPSIR